MARSRPRSKKGRQDAPKSATSWPSWPPSWPSWAHLGSKLAHLAPSWRQDAPRCAKMRPNSHPNGAPDALQIASWAILAPRGSPRTSKVPLEPQFSTIFPRNLHRIRLIFQAAFFNFQPQVRHGGGLARAAHWIRRPLATGVTESSGQFSKIFLNLSSRHPRTLRASTIPHRTYHISKPPIFLPSSPILAHLRHLCPNILPTRSHLDAKIVQDSPTSRQDAPR